MKLSVTFPAIGEGIDLGTFALVGIVTVFVGSTVSVPCARGTPGDRRDRHLLVKKIHVLALEAVLGLLAPWQCRLLVLA